MQLDPKTGTLVLVRGDATDDIPASHRGRLSDAARAVFADPPAYFARRAAECPFPRMKHWLEAVAACPRGELHLYSRYPSDTIGWSGYLAQPDGMHPVLYGSPLDATEYDLKDAPADLRAYYRLVNTLWWGYPGRGGLKGVFDVMPLDLADDFDPRTPGLTDAWDWGSNAAGHTLWFTGDGRAGRLRWEGQIVESFGTIGDAIDYLFVQLIAGRSPE